MCYDSQAAEERKSERRKRNKKEKKKVLTNRKGYVRLEKLSEQERNFSSLLYQKG